MLLKVKGLFDNPLVNDLNLFPHEWWDLIGIGAQTLTHIVRCILAQVCFALSCEQNRISH